MTVCRECRYRGIILSGEERGPPAPPAGFQSWLSTLQPWGLSVSQFLICEMERGTVPVFPGYGAMSV